MTMKDIKELSTEGLREILNSWGEPLFRVRQIFAWIYKKNVVDFGKMSDLSSDLRQRLEEDFYILGIEQEEKHKSRDGTEKFLFRLKDDNYIESAIIPLESRNTGCISTQVGCKFKCAFCASGIGGFRRNLTAGEIIDQVIFLKSSLHRRLSNLVFMGIGEPLDNYQNLMKAIRIINSSDGLNIGARKITISTCGLASSIRGLAKENLQLELSISLHAPDDKTRSLLMSVNKKHPIKELIDACHKYVAMTHRQITFEYILIKNVNSSLKKAQELAKLLKGLNCKVNLIAYNPVKEFKWQAPDKKEVMSFRDQLKNCGVNVTLRRPRGVDIKAGCGQLRLGYEKN